MECVYSLVMKVGVSVCAGEHDELELSEMDLTDPDYQESIKDPAEFAFKS